MNQDFVQLLQSLVEIPSPSWQEAEAVRFLTDWFSQHGFTAEIDSAGNAIGSKGDGPREVMLLGHIDTFPGQPPVRREGNLLYGRGSVDAKGPLCTFTAAVQQVDVPPGWKLTVVGAVEEECATSKGARQMLKSRQSAPPEFCIIGEPSHWDRVTLGYKGRLLLDLTLRVPFSHSAGAGTLPAEQGVIAWQALADLAERFNTQAEPPRTRAFDQLDPSLRAINSHDEGAFGVVTLTVGFRLPLGLHLAELETLARQAVTAALPQADLSFDFQGGELAYRTGKSNPLVRAFLRAIRAEGGQPRFVVKTGTADMNVVGPVWQCPILAYGPGDSSLDHTPDEHLDLTEYERAIAVLTHALRDLLQA